MSPISKPGRMTMPSAWGQRTPTILRCSEMSAPVTIAKRSHFRLTPSLAPAIIANALGKDVFKPSMTFVHCVHVPRFDDKMPRLRHAHHRTADVRRGHETAGTGACAALRNRLGRAERTRVEVATAPASSSVSDMELAFGMRSTRYTARHRVNPAWMIAGELV